MTSPKETHLLFNQHLGYHLREAWISKALLTLLETEYLEAEHPGITSQVFAFPTASDRFGISPSMVQAMRFWLRATGLITEQRRQSARPMPTLTPWGRLLAQADPYLDQPGSIWGLHANLVRNLSAAPVFTWFFQCFAYPARLFTKEECVHACLPWAIQQAPTQTIRQRSLLNDLDCLLHMYLPSERVLAPEEYLALSPFRRLRFLTRVPMSPTSSVRAQYALSPRVEVPAFIVLAFLLEQLTEKPMLVRDLLAGPVGRAFGLTSTALFDCLSQLGALTPNWCPIVRRIEHLEWITLSGTVSPQDVLTHYYQLAARR